MAELAGQLSSRLAAGGLALSCAKSVEEGARAALLLAPGLFRVDVSPREDTLKVQVRNLSDGTCEWSEGGQPLVVAASGGPAVSAHTVRIDLGDRRADVLISARRDVERAVMHFVAQAEVSAAAPAPFSAGRSRGRSSSP
jgi:hypothetical protein